jgi:hypothetical protein
VGFVADKISVDGMRIGKGKLRTLRKPSVASVFPSTMIQARGSQVRLPMEYFFQCTYSSSRSMAPGFTQPAAEMSTGRFVSSDDIRFPCKS